MKFDGPYEVSYCTKRSPNLFYESGRRVAGLEGQYLYLRPDLRRDLRLRQIFDSIVSALDIDGGLDLAQKPYWSIFVKDDHGVYRLKGFQYGSSVKFGDYGTRRSFEFVDGDIGVETYDEGVAEGSRSTQVGDVARVQQIEAAVGEDQPPPRLSQPGYPGRYGAGRLAGG
jgi:hypothetical protein